MPNQTETINEYTRANISNIIDLIVSLYTSIFICCCHSCRCCVCVFFILFLWFHAWIDSSQCSHYHGCRTIRTLPRSIYILPATPVAKTTMFLLVSTAHTRSQMREKKYTTIPTYFSICLFKWKCMHATLVSISIRVFLLYSLFIVLIINNIIIKIV